MSLSDNDKYLPKGDDFWTNLIHDLENNAHLTAKDKMLKDFDYANVIPEDLAQRIKDYMSEQSSSEEPIEEGESEEAEEEQEEFMKLKRAKKDENFNESTCSEVERLEKEYQVFDLKLADKGRSREMKAISTDNWIRDYICKKRRNRVTWGTKLYKMERTLNEMSLEEQAEELMDASAEKFCNWLNNLGSADKATVSKDKLKALFSIEGENNLFSSIMIDPTIVHAISKAVADKWNMPQMAIELKFENFLRNRLKNVPKRVVKVAFGRTVAEVDRPWYPSKSDRPITTVFPEELLSLEVLFKGIRHLRTTKFLVEFLEKHPKFEKPRYLVRQKMFDQKKSAATKKFVPLYDRLKLKY